MTFTWKGKEYSDLVNKNISCDSKWLNLSTKKFKMAPTSSDEFSLKDIMILGCEEDVKEFWKTNVGYFKNHDYNKLKYIPYNDIETMVNLKSLKLTCPLNAPDDDIEKIDVNILNKINDFSLDGLFLKARLADVTDGDTIKVWTIVTISELSKCGKTGNSSACIKDGKMIIKLKCRLYGVNTAEINTSEGKESKNVLMNKLPNIFYIRILGTDKYGRFLIAIYMDKYGKNLYMADGDPYYGGKKNVIWL